MTVILQKIGESLQQIDRWRNNMNNMIYKIGLLSGEVFRLKSNEDFVSISLESNSNCYEFYNKQCVVACFPVHNIAYITAVKGEEE